MQPRVHGRRCGMAETVGKRIDSAFYLSKDTFDRVSQPENFDPILQPFSVERAFEFVCFIDEEDGVVYVVFSNEFIDEFTGYRDRIRRKQPKLKKLPSCRIDRCVQPVPVVVNLDLLLIDRDVLRRLSACRLRSAFVIQSWIAVRLRLAPNSSGRVTIFESESSPR